MSLSALRLREVLRRFSRTSQRSRKPATRSRRRAFLETLEPRRLLAAEALPGPVIPDDWPETYRTFEQLQLDTSEYDSSRILVQFRDDVDAGQVVASSLSGAQLGQPISIGQGMHEVVLPSGVEVSEALDAFSGLDSVVFAEKNYRITLDDTNIPDDPVLHVVVGTEQYRTVRRYRRRGYRCGRGLVDYDGQFVDDCRGD